MNKIAEQIKQKIGKGRLYRIVFVGDSITSCEWIHPNWPEIVEYVLKNKIEEEFERWEISHWNIRCINYAQNGSSSREFLKTINEEVLDYDPDMVILLGLGTGNDLLFKVQKKERMSNYNKIQNILAKNIENFVVSTTIPTNQESEGQRKENILELIEKYQPESNEVFINMFEEMKDYDLKRFFTLPLPKSELSGKPQGSFDSEHPNILGNAYVAKIILKKVYDIEFDPEIYYKTVKQEVKYPSF